MTRSLSRFIRPMHPKTEIKAEPEAIQKVLDAGWVGQLKIHGHRAQIHVSADPHQSPIAYNRQGQIHKKEIPQDLVSELRRLFLPDKDWSVIDCEWMKEANKLYIFDYIKKDGQLLNRLTYPERWNLLPRDFISPCISVLPMLQTLEKCLHALTLSRKEKYIEGLVFKSGTTSGFPDTAIVRCRTS